VPLFTFTNPNLRQDGPTVIFGLGVPSVVAQAMSNSGQAVPPDIQITGLIDTGASQTAIATGLAAQLGLTPVGIVPVTTPSHASVQLPVYYARLSFYQPNGWLDIPVIEMAQQGPSIQCLVGRDVLALGILVYVGPSNTYTLSLG
jgi:predicted aspartyl protease